MINETYGIPVTQLKGRVNLDKLEKTQATEEQETLADIKQSFHPEKNQKNVATCLCSRRLIGATDAYGAGAGLIL